MDDRAFIDAILVKPDDDQLRLVYADWLEDQDDPRAEYLRLQTELHALAWDKTISRRERRKRRPQLQERLRVLRRDIDPNWVTLMDRPGIENCDPVWRFQCPKEWEKLNQTDTPTVRFCETCQQNVYFCQSIGEAQKHASQNRCVAVESSVPRSDNDLPGRVFHVTMGRIARPVPPTRLQIAAEPDEPEGDRPRGRGGRNARRSRNRSRRRRQREDD